MSNNAPRATRAVLPSLPELQKKPVNPQTDGLELCKQAVALLVGDMRAEIQQAVGLLKSEAENATASKNPLATKLLGVADNLQNVEKDALGKMRELLTHSHWELGQRLDQQMQVNALMSDHLGASRDLTVDTVQRIEQSMKRLEVNMTREYGELRSELGKVKEIVVGVSAQVDSESQAVQSHSQQQTSDLEGRFLQQLSSVRSEVDAQITGSSEKLLGALGRLQDETLRGNEGITTIISMEKQLKSIADKITTEVSILQQQDDQHYDKGLVAPVPRRSVAAVASCASRPCSQSPSHVAAISAVVSAGSEVHLQPCGADPRGGAVKFEVEPPLPPGLTLNPATGTISGQPVAAVAERSYCIKAIASTELVLRVDEPEVEEPEGDVVEKVSINEDFATQLEAVTQIENMLPEPPKIRGSYGDWMIWMVHRAHLDDPTLVDFNFGNMHMPPAHLEPRIAPKLVDAMGRNTHIEVLTLSNSNLQKAQGVELAGSLRKNQTVKSVNLECNWLDSNAVRELAVAIKDNPESSIEHLRFSHQKQMGQFFGRPTEEAVGQMMWRNESIVKLGFECDDAHWRNIIDRSLLRNNDFWRKRHAPPDPEALPTAEEHPLGHIRLLQVPEALSKEVLSKYPVLCEYLDNNLKMPTTLQLQNCAKNSGLQLSYTVAAPMIKEFRSWMIDKAVGQQVAVFDVFNTSIHGILRRWSSEHDNWAVEIGTEEGKRCTFRSSKDPAVSVSEQWVDWLRSGKQIGWAQSRAGA